MNISKVVRRLDGMDRKDYLDTMNKLVRINYGQEIRRDVDTTSSLCHRVPSGRND